MTAKQCLRHDWLRGAPMQASPHLRRYLSKSREVLLERVVSRENLRRAALMSQTTSQASLCQTDVRNDQNHHRQQHLQGCLQDCLLSQSEMCLSNRLTGSRTSLAGSEGFPSPIDSQASLNSSRTSLSGTSQSCLLNQEQTQGLLSKAQSRSQVNLNQGLSRGILSRIRSLNHVQSQACLLNGSSAVANRIDTAITLNPVISKSREKLYGLRSLSKSQGVLDIYRSLECLKRRRKNYQRATTEDMLPIFKQLGTEITSRGLAISISDDRVFPDVKSEINLASDKTKQAIDRDVPTISTVNAKTLTDDVDSDRDDLRTVSDGSKCEMRNVELLQIPKKHTSEENLDSLKSVESDTLTEDSDEMLLSNAHSDNTEKRPCERQHSDVSSHSNNSQAFDDKEDRSTESENEEPKYTVAQLVSAFNKHQEVASKTSLETIMSARQINEVMFPTGTKALRLFIPDINITESKIVRRKTSYKPRKNWEELRKRNEKNEGVLKSLNNDSGNEDDDDEDETRSRMKDNPDEDFIKNAENSVTDTSQEPTCQEEDMNSSLNQWSLLQSGENNGQSIFVSNANTTSTDNLDTRIDEKYKQCVKGAMCGKTETPKAKSQKYSELSEAQPKITISVRQKERLPNYIYPDITPAVRDDNHEAVRKTSVAKVNGRNESRITPKLERAKSSFGADTIANVNLKDILQRIDDTQSTSRENMENLRKRTSIAKIILNDNLVQDNQDTSGYRVNSRAKSEPPSIGSQPEERAKLIVPPFFVRSSSLSSDSSCPTPSSVQSDINVSWEDVQTVERSTVPLEKEDNGKTTKRSDIQRTSSEGKNRQCTEDRKVWGRICTGSYTRAIEKFSGKNMDTTKRSQKSTIAQQTEKNRRKSSSCMPHYINLN
jgi:hypothetical protein